MTKKQIQRKLIKLQNRFGKKLGKTAWQQWKIENGQNDITTTADRTRTRS